MYDGFGGLTPSCREDSRLRGEAGPTISWCNCRRNCDWTSATIYYGENLWEIMNWNGNSFLDSFRENSWVEEWIAMWTKYLFQSRDTTTSAKIWLQKEQLKIRNLVLQNGDNLALRKLVLQAEWESRRSGMPHSKHNSHQGKKVEVVLELKGHHTPLNPTMSMFVMILRHCDQEERDSDGAMHWDLIQSRLFEEFGSRVGQNYYQQDWLQAIHEGSNKTRFEYCKNFLRSSDLCPCNSRTRWWKHGIARIDGIRENSVWLEGVFCSRWGVPFIWALHRRKGSQLAEMKRKVEDIQFSSPRLIHLVRIMTRELEANPSL